MSTRIHYISSVGEKSSCSRLSYIRVVDILVVWYIGRGGVHGLLDPSTPACARGQSVWPTMGCRLMIVAISCDVSMLDQPLSI